MKLRDWILAIERIWVNFCIYTKKPKNKQKERGKKMAKLNLEKYPIFPKYFIDTTFDEQDDWVIIDNL